MSKICGYYVSYYKGTCNCKSSAFNGGTKFNYTQDGCHKWMISSYMTPLKKLTRKKIASMEDYEFFLNAKG